MSADVREQLHQAGQAHAELVNRFTYHRPTDAQAVVYPQIRQAALNVAQMLTATCPPSRELSLAITHLEETVFWANAAIARHGLMGDGREVESKAGLARDSSLYQPAREVLGTIAEGVDG